ncbi:MAG: Bax inhibitor-1/YccA family protein [Deltaproteobacteria bacterium]
MYNDNSGIRERDVGLSSYVSRVFGWMFIGLLVTAFFAFSVAGTDFGKSLINPGMMILFIVIELGLIFALSFLINRISSTTATLMFLAYSAVNGITLSTIFYVYDIGVIFKAFGVAAAVFGVMALYGNITKNDLTNVGSIFFMGVIGILIASVINMFFRSPMVDLIISYVTVFIFSGLVAYDAQKIKSYYQAGGEYGSDELIKKGAIISALALYLDFINIFIALLRIFDRD